jgi:hypothetical protein
MEFQSRAVRCLVELHDAELRRFVETWRRFVESGAPMPEARGDDTYESRETLCGHILGAARGYLTWMCEQVGRPVTDIDVVTRGAPLAAQPEATMETILAAWRRHLAPFVDAELSPAVYPSRWGEPYLIEQMLEHAVVHPMRHRRQLERAIVGER